MNKYFKQKKINELETDWNDSPMLVKHETE